MPITTRPRGPARKIEYPSGDGKPMAETDWHRDVMIDQIQVLDQRFADKPMVYVSGNMLMYYVRGDKRRHVSPDVFVVFGIPKKQRDYFLVWEEGKSPDLVIEVTSKSTRQEDLKKKMQLYQDVLKVKEYVLFDPLGEYLKPRLQGHRLHKGFYEPIELVAGRLPSKVLDLHFEAEGTNLRLYDPATRTWLPTLKERAQEAEGRAARLEEEVEQLRQSLKKLRDPKK